MLIQIIVGYVFIFSGLALVFLAVLAWLGKLKPKLVDLAAASGWDVLLALVQKLPWIVFVGLLLVYAGLELIGVALPF